MKHESVNYRGRQKNMRNNCVFFKLLTLLTLPIALASYLFSVLFQTVFLFFKNKKNTSVWSIGHRLFKMILTFLLDCDTSVLLFRTFVLLLFYV